jgi:hypothetical protein
LNFRICHPSRILAKKKFHTLPALGLPHDWWTPS